MTLSPAAADTGILFRAADGTLIPANTDHVVDTHSATTVGAFGVRVRTIEHLMAAAAALGIDNLMVDIDGPRSARGGRQRQALRGPAALGRAGEPARPRAGRSSISEPIRVGDEQPLDRDRCRRTRSASATRSTTTIRSSGCRRRTFGINEEVFCDELAAGADVRLPPGRPGHAAERPGARRLARQRDRGRQALGAQRQPALPRRVRPPQDPRPGGRPVPPGAAARGPRDGPQRRPRAEPPAGVRDPEGPGGRPPARRRAGRPPRLPAPVAAGDGFLPGVAAL